MEFLGGFVLILLALFLILIVVLNIKIVPQSKAYVIERLGTYSTTWQTGLHMKIPFYKIQFYNHIIPIKLNLKRCINQRL